MTHRLFCNRRLRQIKDPAFALFALAFWALALAPSAFASNDAPQWMHALANVPLPAHDEKTDAVELYSEHDVAVMSEEKIRRTVRVAYKILRPAGRSYGEVIVRFNAHEKVSNLRGWCIPAEGKDYEVRDKDSAEVSLPKVEGSDLISDVRAKVLRIPAPDPGNIVGYEYDLEEHPFVLEDEWRVQHEIP